MPAAKMAAKKSAEKTYKETREGYSVWTTSFLYQLNWNDSAQAVFYTQHWMSKGSTDAAKKEAFETSEAYQMQLVGYEKSVSMVLVAGGRSEEEIINVATVRNIDAVYAKLQKKYDVFKPKTPLVSSDPLTAKIGMKEGLEGGEKFDVLEQTMDPETQLTKYVVKGSITVDASKLWDNRFNAGEEEGDGNASLGATHFKGGKKFYPGMLIRQAK